MRVADLGLYVEAGVPCPACLQSYLNDSITYIACMTSDDTFVEIVGRMKHCNDWQAP